MLSPAGAPGPIRILLATAPVDLRRGHDGLAALVRASWGEDVYAGHLFVFVGRRRDRIKVLWWETGGFALFHKRLERGRFRLPADPGNGPTLRLEAAELRLLLDGFDWRRVTPPPRWRPAGA